jgi:ubiquitin-conjugating enzyme E2 S
MEALSTNALKRIAKEVKDLGSTPLEGFTITINDEDISVIHALLEGPQGTPYETGLFSLRLNIPASFPNEPPKGTFTTKIFHPNVSAAGEICVNVLKKDWTPETTIRHVLMVIRCLLVDPNPASALNEEAGKLLIEDFSEFSRHARLMTSIHAKRPAGPLTASSQVNASAQPKSEGESPSKKAKPSEQVTLKDASKVKKSMKRL